jgi:sialic acid synthase SpsE
MVFGLDAINAIDEHVIPAYMEGIGVANARKLTSEQKDEVNLIRGIVLSSIKFGDDLSQDNIVAIAEKSSDIMNKDIVNLIDKELREFTNNHGTIPTLGQRKTIESFAWANYHANISLDETNINV